VFCEGKVMVIDDFKAASLTQAGKTTTTRPPRSDKGHAEEMKAFLDLASGKPAMTLTFADCVASMVATFKVVESLTKGMPVDVPRIVTAT